MTGIKIKYHNHTEIDIFSLVDLFAHVGHLVTSVLNWNCLILLVWHLLGLRAACRVGKCFTDGCKHCWFSVFCYDSLKISKSTAFSLSYCNQLYHNCKKKHSVMTGWDEEGRKISHCKMYCFLKRNNQDQICMSSSHSLLSSTTCKRKKKKKKDPEGFRVYHGLMRLE